MGKLIYLLTTSVDGYVSDKSGNFDFTTPSEEVHRCINENLRNVGTFLFGRKVYELMKVWDAMPANDESEATNEFAEIWRGASKIVYSSSLSEVTTDNTSLERVFDLEEIQKMMSESDKDFNIGGPHLATSAIKANIIDEYHQFIAPVILGNGTNWLPENMTSQLELTALQKFDNGTVHLQYNKSNGTPHHF